MSPLVGTAAVLTVNGKLKMKRKYYLERKAQTWDLIENRYIEDWQGEHERLLELVRYIKISNYK